MEVTPQVRARYDGALLRAPRPTRSERRSATLTLGLGTGHCIAQHGELLQGQIEEGGRARRFLISLPCDRLYSQVTFEPAWGSELTVTPAHKLKVRRVVALTLERLGLSGLGGAARIESNITEGKGYGSSTADCTAAVLAVADAVSCPLAEAEVAELVVLAEIASDNFMFSRAVVFAHREGVVIEDLGPRLPSLEVVGVDTETDGVVNTLEHPPALYDWRQMQTFQMLIAAARCAVRRGDPGLLGQVATASALVNEQFLPKRVFAELRALADDVQALGLAVAHSGTVVSLLFDPNDPSLEARLERTECGLQALGLSGSLRFRT